MLRCNVQWNVACLPPTTSIRKKMYEEKKAQSCRYRQNSEINENIAPQSDNVFNFFVLSNVGISFHTHTRRMPNRMLLLFYSRLYLLLNLAQLGLEFDTRCVGCCSMFVLRGECYSETHIWAEHTISDYAISAHRDNDKKKNTISTNDKETSAGN